MARVRGAVSTTALECGRHRTFSLELQPGIMSSSRLLGAWLARTLVLLPDISGFLFQTVIMPVPDEHGIVMSMMSIGGVGCCYIRDIKKYSTNLVLRRKMHLIFLFSPEENALGKIPGA